MVGKRKGITKNPNGDKRNPWKVAGIKTVNAGIQGIKIDTPSTVINAWARIPLEDRSIMLYAVREMSDTYLFVHQSLSVVLYYLSVLTRDQHTLVTNALKDIANDRLLDAQTATSLIRIHKNDTQRPSTGIESYLSGSHVLSYRNLKLEMTPIVGAAPLLEPEPVDPRKARHRFLNEQKEDRLKSREQKDPSCDQEAQIYLSRVGYIFAGYIEVEKQRESKSEFEASNAVYEKYSALEAKLLALREKGAEKHLAWLRMFCLALLKDPEADQSELFTKLKRATHQLVKVLVIALEGISDIQADAGISNALYSEKTFNNKIIIPDWNLRSDFSVVQSRQPDDILSATIINRVRQLMETLEVVGETDALLEHDDDTDVELGDDDESSENDGEEDSEDEDASVRRGNATADGNSSVSSQRVSEERGEQSQVSEGYPAQQITSIIAPPIPKPRKSLIIGQQAQQSLPSASLSFDLRLESSQVKGPSASQSSVVNLEELTENPGCSTQANGSESSHSSSLASEFGLVREDSQTDEPVSLTLAQEALKFVVERRSSVQKTGHQEEPSSFVASPVADDNHSNVASPVSQGVEMSLEEAVGVINFAQVNGDSVTAVAPEHQTEVAPSAAQCSMKESGNPIYPAKASRQDQLPSSSHSVDCELFPERENALLVGHVPSTSTQDFVKEREQFGQQEGRQNYYSTKLAKLRPQRDAPQCLCPLGGTNRCGISSPCINQADSTVCGAQCRYKNGQCANQELRRGDIGAVEVYGDIGSQGLRATAFIAKNTHIAQYIGIIINVAEMEKKRQDADKGRYIMKLHGCTPKLYVDADDQRFTNASRFINHSCKPNCDVRQRYMDGRPVLQIHAKQNIVMGTTLTYNYRYEVYEDGNGFQCNCETEECVGWVGQTAQPALKRHKKEQKVDLSFHIAS